MTLSKIALSWSHIVQNSPTAPIALERCRASLSPEYLGQAFWFRKHVIIANFSWNTFCFQTPLARERRWVVREEVCDGKLKERNFVKTGKMKTIHEGYSKHSFTRCLLEINEFVVHAHNYFHSHGTGPDAFSIHKWGAEGSRRENNHILLCPTVKTTG